MENNRRSFFKGLATFASGVIAAKVASYTPNKEQQKEELMVSSALTIEHEGEEYHPLVVKKTEKDGMLFDERKSTYLLQGYKPKMRKAEI